MYYEVSYETPHYTHSAYMTETIHDIDSLYGIPTKQTNSTHPDTPLIIEYLCKRDDRHVHSLALNFFSKLILTIISQPHKTKSFFFFRSLRQLRRLKSLAESGRSEHRIFKYLVPSSSMAHIFECETTRDQNQTTSHKTKNFYLKYQQIEQTSTNYADSIYDTNLII